MNIEELRRQVEEQEQSLKEAKRLLDEAECAEQQTKVDDLVIRCREALDRARELEDDMKAAAIEATNSQSRAQAARWNLDQARRSPAKRYETSEERRERTENIESLRRALDDAETFAAEAYQRHQRIKLELQTASKIFEDLEYERGRETAVLRELKRRTAPKIPVRDWRETFVDREQLTYNMMS